MSHWAVVPLVLLSLAWGAPSAQAALDGPPSPAADPSRALPASYGIAHVRHTVNLRARPGGPVIARSGPRTEFGSPTTFGVVASRRNWLGVLSPSLPNNRPGWVRRRSVRVARTTLRVRIDLSRRLLLMERGGQVIRRIDVGVGRASSPTPTGRFAVTDKLSGARFGLYYGCCVLALSGHQTHLPAGWRGGDPPASSARHPGGSETRPYRSPHQQHCLA